MNQGDVDTVGWLPLLMPFFFLALLFRPSRSPVSERPFRMKEKVDRCALVPYARQRALTHLRPHEDQVRQLNLDPRPPPDSFLLDRRDGSRPQAGLRVQDRPVGLRGQVGGDEGRSGSDPLSVRPHLLLSWLKQRSGKRAHLLPFTEVGT